MILKRIFKQPLFCIGFFFITAILIVSFIFDPFFDEQLAESKKVIYNEQHEPIALAPYPPSYDFPLGSDALGNDVLIQVLQGAKFTIGLAILIGLARVILSLGFGYILYLLPSRLMRVLKDFTDAFHYAPLSIFAYFLVAPVIVVFSWNYSGMTKTVFPTLIIILLAVPILSLFIGDEIKQIFKLEFIQNARLLGGSRGHVFFKHVTPFLAPRLFVIFTQQVGQALMIFAHLGLLEVFIGGTDRRLWEMTLEREPIIKVFSMSNEWGGLIAKSFSYMTVFPWMVLGPVVGFALTILATNFIVEGIKNASDQTSFRKRKVTKRKSKQRLSVEESGFVPIKKIG